LTTRTINSSKLRPVRVYPLRGVMIRNTDAGKNAINSVSNVKFRGFAVGYARSLIIPDMVAKRRKHAARIKIIPSNIKL
jgi:hypothetical protein